MPPDVPSSPRVQAVLFDRDGTLIVNIPYTGDPGAVRVVAGAPEACELLRRAGIPTAVVSNQSGIGRGLVTAAEVDAVNRRVVELLGPLGPWFYCPHRPDEGCACRKPEPDMLLDAAASLGVDIARCVMIGDALTDMEAATAAGCMSVLVPSDGVGAGHPDAGYVSAPSVLSAVQRIVQDAAETAG